MGVLLASYFAKHLKIDMRRRTYDFLAKGV